MNPSLPHTIENCIGEKLIFREQLREPDGDRLLVENFVQPGVGPLMHTHWLQDECLTVVSGRIGYQLKGGKEKFAGPGESILFKKGTPHRFWNAGESILHCQGYIKPANTIVFFLSSIFEAQNKAGGARPELFDSAYLITRYRSEYDLHGIPWGAKKIIIPITYWIGKLLGKYEHFRNAPAPVKIKKSL